MSNRQPQLKDPFVRAELGSSPEGRRALDHWVMAHSAEASSKKRRAHKRIAERLAKKVLNGNHNEGRA